MACYYLRILTVVLPDNNASFLSTDFPLQIHFDLSFEMSCDSLGLGGSFKKITMISS